MKTLISSEISRFCRGLSLLLHAGVSTAEGVYLLSEEEDKPFQEILLNLSSLMDQGLQLSDAMEEIPFFSDRIVGMIRIGETTGRLEETLESLAEFYEGRDRVSRQLKNAIAYPGMLLLLILTVIIVLLVEVLPIFEDVYASLGGHLTGLSAGMLHVGQWIRTIFPVLLVLLLAVVVCGGVYLFCSGVRQKINSRLQQRFGDISVLKKYNNAHLAQALSMGMQSGLSVDEAMELSLKLVADIPGARERCETCLTMLSNGDDLADILSTAGILSSSQGKMLSIGMRGGNADQMMTDISDKLMEEANYSLESLIMKIEPTMVLAASLIVGMILLSTMLPLMNIMSMIG